MSIRLRRRGDVASGPTPPHALLQDRLKLAADMLTLALHDATTIPQGQLDALKEALRRVARVQAWCATHPPEGETV